MSGYASANPTYKILECLAISEDIGVNHVAFKKSYNLVR